MNRLTYKSAGDANRRPHYCHGCGIKKDDLLQRLGFLEDILDYDGFWQVCISAFRYALGRRTYIVSIVCGFMTPLLALMPDVTLSVLVRDIREHGRPDEQKAYGDDCDYNEWMRLLNAAEMEQKRRENNAED